MYGSLLRFIFIFCNGICPGKNLKEKLLTLEEDLIKLTDSLQREAQCIPNITHPEVPIGGEDDSTIRKMVFLLFFVSFTPYFISSNISKYLMPLNFVGWCSS